jgi:plastocyanin
MKRSIWLSVSCIAGAWAVACSSTSTGGTQGTSSGGGGHTTTSTPSTSSGSTSSTSGSTSSTSSGGTSSTSSGTTTTGGMVNGCDPAATTETTGDATITFTTGTAPMQYAPACVKIKAGSKVTWNGAFNFHPLTPDDATSPIVYQNTGTTATFTFPSTGAFGYHCDVHPSAMLGAVFVDP